MTETLILVDEKDTPQGTGEKMDVHRKGLRHRAFSVMVYNQHGEMLIQRRADCKYHSAGFWANTCCGHPRPEEPIEKAAKRRLGEELGFSCDLTKVTEVCYTLPLENGLHENEYTHVFEGIYEGEFTPNPDEVSETMWVAPEELRADALASPEKYARWFHLYLTEYFDQVFRIKKAA